jgi:hypothetical protein
VVGGRCGGMGTEVWKWCFAVPIFGWWWWWWFGLGWVGLGWFGGLG